MNCGCFPPLEAGTTISHTLKASPEGGGFNVRSSSGALGLVSKAHGVFSNRDLLSTSEKQPRAIAIAYTFYMALESSDQQLRRVFLVFGSGVFVR